MKDLTIIIPTLNEAENISPLIAQLTKVIQGRSISQFLDAEILVVDDNSSDDTL